MAAGSIAAPNAAKAAGAGGIGFNKMFVMVPVMLAARKLDAEDPKIVHYLRVAYGSMQTICVLVVLYTYWKASSKIDGTKIVYVPAAATVRCVVLNYTEGEKKRCVCCRLSTVSLSYCTCTISILN